MMRRLVYMVPFSAERRKSGGEEAVALALGSGGWATMAVMVPLVRVTLG